MTNHIESPALPLARAIVRQFAPYLSPTLYALIPAPVEDMRRIANGPMAVTEQLVLLYDPEWVATEDPHVVATGLAHECLHVLLEHVKRGTRYADMQTFFIACDLFINGVMVDQKRSVRSKASNTSEERPLWLFPEWAILPAQYKWPNGLTAHEYYLRLKQLEQAQEKKKGAGKEEGPDKKEGTSAASSDDSPGNDAADDADSGHHHDKDSQGSETKKNKFMAGCCGSVAGAAASNALEAAKNAEKKGGRSEAYKSHIVKLTSQAIKEHLQATGRGNTPGIWSELITASDEVFDVPWETLLSEVSSHTIDNIRVGGADYSRRRPSKRSYLRGIMLPGLVDYDPCLWLVVDSSGSMGKPQLGAALRVCADVIAQTNTTQVYYLEADVKVQKEPMLVCAADLYQMQILGRGGTDFRQPIEQACKAIPRPDMLIYITDGDGTVPDEPPHNMEVVWCIVPSSHTKPAAWGQTIFLK